MLSIKKVECNSKRLKFKTKGTEKTLKHFILKFFAVIFSDSALFPRKALTQLIDYIYPV